MSRAPAATFTPPTYEPPPAGYGADPTMRSPVGRDKGERQLIASLEARRAWLSERIEQGPADNAANWHRQERAALTWALARIAELERVERDRPPGRQESAATRVAVRQEATMSEQPQGEQTASTTSTQQDPAQTATTEVNVEGDAVVNQAPDGGGVDNNAAEQTGDSSEQ